MGLAIGVDVGGTKVAAGVVADDGSVLARTRRVTPSGSPAQTEAVIVEVVGEITALHPDADVVGIGAAGWVSADRATVVYAPNLAWRDEPLRERVAAAVRLPVVVENDANAAAWAEHRYGAARDVDDVVLVTAGTGIGTGIIAAGRLCRGGFGMAGEAGHMVVEPGGRRCGCGQLGCWEQYASGNALVRAARERGAPEDMGGAAVTAAAEQGDAVALACFAEVGRRLGEGLATLAAVLDPAVFVVGGGLADAGELLLAPARAAFRARLPGGQHRPHPEIRRAELGNEAGLVGAADLARATRG